MNRSTKLFKPLLFLLIAISILSFVTVTLASGFDVGHECAGEDCLICLGISLRENMTDILLIFASLLSLFALIVFAYHVSIITVSSFTSETPVRLKVKLSN